MPSAKFITQPSGGSSSAQAPLSERKRNTVSSSSPVSCTASIICPTALSISITWAAYTAILISSQSFSSTLSQSGDSSSLGDISQISRTSPISTCRRYRCLRTSSQPHR